MNKSLLSLVRWSVGILAATATALIAMAALLLFASLAKGLLGFQDRFSVFALFGVPVALGAGAVGVSFSLAIPLVAAACLEAPKSGYLAAGALAGLMHAGVTAFLVEHHRLVPWSWPYELFGRFTLLLYGKADDLWLLVFLELLAGCAAGGVFAHLAVQTETQRKSLRPS